MKHSTIPAIALSLLCLGAIPGRAAPGSGVQAGRLRRHVDAEGPAMTAVPGRRVAGRASLRVRDEVPHMPYDPNTTSECTWWYDNDGGMSCQDLLSFLALSGAQFAYWNPSVTETCGNFQTGFSYCVEGPAVPVPTTRGSSTTTTTTTTTTGPATTQQPGNGIETPTPIQSGMVGNCDAFHFVEEGQSCTDVLSKNGITLAQLFSWNPSVKADCSGMWANVYVCVSTVGHTPSAPTTTTTRGNGIATPTPIQEGMVGNCDKFHFVEEGESCTDVLAKNGITMAQLFAWNPAVKSNCSGMWARVYVCVSTVGHTPSTPTTTRGNGIATPTPIQSGMVGNCNKFHFVEDGQTCADVLSRNGITMAQLFAWNPAVKSNCSGLWARVHVCVGVM